MEYNNLKVRFSEDTKKHDGLCPQNKLFELYFECICKKYDVNKFLEEKKFSELEIIKILLINLIERLNSSKNKIIPLIPQGGGKCYQIGFYFLEYLSYHLQYLEKIIINKQNQVG